MDCATHTVKARLKRVLNYAPLLQFYVDLTRTGIISCFSMLVPGV